MSDKTIMNLYQAQAIAPAKTSPIRNYYLVKFKEPAAAGAQKVRLLKRVSYNFYVVEAPGKIQWGRNVASVVAANSLWKATDNLLQLWQKHPNSNQAVELSVTAQSDSVITDLKKYGAVTVMQNNLGGWKPLALRPRVALRA